MRNLLHVAFEGLLEHSVEIVFAILFGIGAKWAKIFVNQNDWSDKIEQLVDFVLICQSWIICPFLLMISWIKALPQSAGVALPVLFIVQLLFLGNLLMWRRSEFFKQRRVVQTVYRFFPISLLVLKMLIGSMNRNARDPNVAFLFSPF